MSSRVEDIRPVRGTRFVYINVPLPPGIAGGGAVEVDGVWMPIRLMGDNSVVDKRWLKRRFRQLHRATLRR